MGTLEQTEQAGAQGAGRNKRSVKGLLIDRRFQLKYTLIVVVLAAVIATVMGVLLVSKVKENTQLAVNSVRAVAAMQEKGAVAAADIADSLKGSEAALETRDREAMLFLILCLVGLVLAITLLGIYVTHKVAGPLFVMQRYLRQIASGNLRDVRHLRKGDELVEFFGTFEQMLRALQDRNRQDVATLEASLRALRDQLERLHGGASTAGLMEELSHAIDQLAAMKKQKQEALG